VGFLTAEYLFVTIFAEKLYCSSESPIPPNSGFRYHVHSLNNNTYTYCLHF
jgi:hypothetical protein